jgi:4-hydroxyacetophenone monooxygenase
MVQDNSELLSADDETIDRIVAHGDPMALRAVLYQLTGDPELRSMAVREHRNGWRVSMAVADDADVATVHSKAAQFLKSYRDSGAGELSIGPADRLLESLGLSVGAEVPAGELDLWLEELAVYPWARGFSWKGDAAPPEASTFSVVVIGAGLGGLNAAVHLKRAKIPFTVLERNSGIGGTWWANRYPGARVDSPSRVYTHVYGASYVHPYPFCPQEENSKYIDWIADTFDVRGDVQLDIDVKSVVWDEDALEWEITAEGPDGGLTYRANAVISAVGLFSRPNLPRLEGLDDFQGLAFHTAGWPSDLDLSDKRVAVVGSGCTGYQLIPEVAKAAVHTFAVQRSPNWVFETPGYLAPYAGEGLWLDRNFPYLKNFLRFQVAWRLRPDVAIAVFAVDPEFRDEHTVSAINHDIREQRLAFMRSKFADRPDLMEKMTPVAPPMSARPVNVDPDDSIYDALLRDDVTLVTEGIRRVTSDSIELSNGTRHGVDVIVFATGFRANDFLWPMEVRGKADRRIEDLWAKDGARAYLGTLLPGFPNFFMIYGPNSNQISGLQVIDMEELVTKFIVETIGGLIEQQKRTVDVGEDAYWRYNAEVDKAESLKIYMDPRASNYYQNGQGRSAANGPIDTRILWNWYRNPANRPESAGQLELSASALDRFHAIDPHFGTDLIVQ